MAKQGRNLSALLMPTRTMTAMWNRHFLTNTGCCIWRRIA